ncbi:D-alanine--D-alanine ligase [Quadrisphaera sp. GCM10027208]|jgi:D-alanine-D-alanine ligase|uniref:D-alanine--D-alanine ligase family protein n=1 Tax=Quadrisphaera sp. GCM10027208 TaxID=3273423 RepID=UPI003623A53E|nr:D-alanine--D-alanine ligase [Kineosporiaceae bacterium SCSIO 59966]
MASSGTGPRVLVLAGGLSHERDVSLRSGRRVAEALRAAGCEVTTRDVDADLLPSLESDRPDVVWPLLHGSTGEDGAVRDVLELLDLPYVGAEPAACRRAFDKPVARSVVAAAGLAVPTGVALPHSVFRELGARAVLAALVDRLGLPLAVKPARGGSALGVSVVEEPSELPRAMVDCYGYGEVALVERAVRGTEVAVSVVADEEAPRALPAVEIVPAAGTVYGYDARYTAGGTEYFVPARLEEKAASAAAEAALTAHRTLGLRDLSRTDLIVDAEGTPWFLETNVAPGMTELSLLPQGLTAAGDDHGWVYRRLVERALARRG